MAKRAIVPLVPAVESTPETRTIRVRAVRRGFYGNFQRHPGEEFLVVPIILADGSVHPAEKQLSLDRKLGAGKTFRGWMKVLGDGRPQEPSHVPMVAQTREITRGLRKAKVLEPVQDGPEEREDSEESI